MKEEGGQRRSARISALEEKARALALERKAKAKAAMMNVEANQTLPKRRGRKRKSLHDMEEESGNDETAWNQSLQEMPSKVVLEFILDLIIQRKEPMFLQPSDRAQVKENQGNFNDSKDFGAIRAKIREGAYSSMAEFECDVSLITKNPMNFSSAARFMSEARTISELADQLFSSLRTEPEKLPSEESQKRSDGKKLLGSGGQLQFFDRRATYAPAASSKSKNDSVLSLELKEPQILELVPKSKGAYIKSYLSFLNGLGTKAQLFGSRQLTKSLNAASLIRKWNPSTPLTSTSDPKTQRFNSVGSVRPFTYLRGAHAGPVIREPPHQRSRSVCLLPRSFIANREGSYKGKAIAVDDGMNSFNSYGGGMNSDNSCPPWERPQGNNGGSGNSFFFGGIRDVDTSKTIGFNNGSNDETTGNNEDNHLLFATLWQDNSPNTTSESSFLPLNESGRFPNVLPSKIIAPTPSSTTKSFAGSMNFPMESSNTPSPSSMQKNYAGSMMFPIQSENYPSPSTPNNYAGLMSFPIQSPNIPSPSSTPNNYAGSMSFQIPSPNTPLPGIDMLYSKGKAPMTPVPGLEYYKHPQPSTSRNITAPETPWYETINTTAGLGFNFMDPFGEGSSNTSAFSLDKHSSRSSQEIQTSEWNRAASWDMQTTLDPPNLQAQAINQKPLPRYSFMQLLQGIPQEQDFLDETGFLEGNDPQGHQALANTRTFWNGTASMPIDLELNEQPDLNLQL